MKLVIGNKNYSSWSLRPWIAMKALGIPFEEILIPFGSPVGNPEFKARVARIFAGRAWCRCWSTATSTCGRRSRSWNISPRNFPTSSSGRRTRKARAAGARALQRDACGLCGAARRMPDEFPPAGATRALSAAAQANVARVDAMWSDCRRALWRAVPVRQVLRRRCHVCAGGRALPHLRHRGQPRGARLHGGR